MNLNRLLRAALAGITLAAAALGACAKPITLVCPFAAGGANDIIARVYAEKMSAILGTPVIVDNKPSAGGLLAAQYVRRAPADGGTLLVASNTTLIAPHVFRTPGYAMSDFVGVSPLYTTGVVLLARPDQPVKNLAELVAAARQAPGKLTYATNGIGTFAHLQMELFKERTGIDLVHVPYKSLPEATQAVLGHNVDFAIDTPISAAPRVQGGQLQAVVVFGGTRERTLPQTPTNSEEGFAEPDPLLAFAGVLAPATTPKEVLEPLLRASEQVMKDPDFVAKVRANNVEAFPVRNAEFNRLLQAYDAKYRDVIARLKVPMN